MKMKEYLTWILDRPKSETERMRKALPPEAYQKWQHQHFDDKIQKNKEFVRVLGQKCDAVGWSRFELTAPGGAELLEKIEAFCRDGGWLARGYYSRTFEGLESDWYEVHPPLAEMELDPAYTGKNTPPVEWPWVTKAYLNRERPLLDTRIGPLVSEAFREACLKHEIPADFCWLRDIGRYDSCQYFFLYPRAAVPKLAWGRDLYFTELFETSAQYRRPHGPGSELYRRFEQLGGFLPRVAETFYDLHAELPKCYPAAGMPESGFAFVYWAIGEHWSDRRYQLLVHRDTAERLIGEKVLSPRYLTPVLLYDTVPRGYMEQAALPFPVPGEARRAELYAQYEAMKNKKRPLRKATEKEALSVLRKAKHLRKNEFAKGMKRTLAPALDGTAWEPLKPYYLLADGGALSDEYELLSYEAAQAATTEFHADMAEEGLLEEQPEGIVFVRCADGDKVVLRPDGTVARFSHEEPEVCEEWPSLAQFFVDTVKAD